MYSRFGKHFFGSVCTHAYDIHISVDWLHKCVRFGSFPLNRLDTWVFSLQFKPVDLRFVSISTLALALLGVWSHLKFAKIHELAVGTVTPSRVRARLHQLKVFVVLKFTRRWVRHLARRSRPRETTRTPGFHRIHQSKQHFLTSGGVELSLPGPIPQKVVIRPLFAGDCRSVRVPREELLRKSRLFANRTNSWSTFASRSECAKHSNQFREIARIVSSLVCQNNLWETPIRLNRERKRCAQEGCLSDGYACLASHPQSPRKPLLGEDTNTTAWQALVQYSLMGTEEKKKNGCELATTTSISALFCPPATGRATLWSNGWLGCTHLSLFLSELCSLSLSLSLSHTHTHTHTRTHAHTSTVCRSFSGLLKTTFFSSFKVTKFCWSFQLNE